MFATALARAAELSQKRLTSAMAGFGDFPVAEAMRYAVSGGKGLRGFLVLESAKLHEIDTDEAVSAAAAIEALHAYSLIHDDLPAMDDDDLRRGQPTVHKKWDDATAILAGDALQSLAFELVAANGPTGSRSKLVETLAIAGGAQGMVRGQALDIAAETSTVPLTIEEITELQASKTGALIHWSACAGPRMAQADIDAMDQYAKSLGLAFQIADDILDVEGDAEIVGKAVGKDGAAHKATFVSLMGLDGAKRRAEELITEAQDALSIYGDGADLLREAAQFVITRKK
jgi:farnesyl diphosphate synthase